MISFDVNNGGELIFEQAAHDNNITVISKDSTGAQELCTIKNGDFVMLYNLYRYIKENDNQNDFINYYGKNTEV